ncbi:MAG: histone deacetylase [Sporocytophaga sp.]|uniref:histone deacetylase family protein n=1 Tax=Sporocytophaga sp. TaxID=2231183 RepID=UPI001AFD28CC|nr:histone deacetylase [Sporocytophaga sp.]MBO9700687.1 histone deacetylase [Sporocytophaga sp.]
MLKIAWSKEFNHPLPEGHRFPMIKYDLIPEQLLYEGTIGPENLFKPAFLSEENILLTHTVEYWHKLKYLELSLAEIRRTGFPLSKELIDREVIIMGGTYEASLFARKYGIAMNVAGGTHHAYTDKGEGFCLLNDNAISANILIAQKLAAKVLIVDLDVHQGDGTAEIFKNKNEVFTFSIHGANNFPAKKEKSDLDIPLPDKTGDKEYLKILDSSLNKILEKVQPDFIFYQSGVDALSTDKLGKLMLSREGCKQRDFMVLDLCKRNKIPLTISMGGGYSENIKDILEAHCNTFRLAQSIFF